MIKIFIVILIQNSIFACEKGCLLCQQEICTFCDIFDSYKQKENSCEKFTKDSNCELYFLNGQCIECGPDYYLESGKCVEIITKIPDCLYYSSKTQCSLCDFNKQLYLKNNNCLPISKEVENCLVYQNDTTCLLCKKGFSVTYDGKECIKSEIKDCLYVSVVECQKCSNLYIKNFNQYLDNIFNLINSEKKTALVEEIKDLDNSFLVLTKQNLCQKVLQENCLKYQSFDKCLECPLGYYLDSSQKCQLNPTPQIPNCKIYLSEDTCGECENRFFLNSSTDCQAVDAVENCSIYDGTADKTVCDLCEDEYFWNDTTKRCQSRKFSDSFCNFYKYDKDECLECVDTHHLTDDDLKCLQKINNCSVYDSNDKDTETLNCKKCSDGYLLNGKICENDIVKNCAKYTAISTFEEAECEECRNQFYKKQDFCQSISDIQNCVDYDITQDKTCVECQETHFNFHLSEICLEETEVTNCLEYDFVEDEFVCIECELGHNLTENRQCEDFTDDFPFCVETNGDFDECIRCEEHKVLHKGVCRDPLAMHSHYCLEQTTNNTKYTNSIHLTECEICKINSIPLNYSDHVVCKETFSIDTPTVSSSKCRLYDLDSECIVCQKDYVLNEGQCVSECPSDKVHIVYYQEKSNFCGSIPEGQSNCTKMSESMSGNLKCLNCLTVQPDEDDDILNNFVVLQVVDETNLSENSIKVNPDINSTRLINNPFNWHIPQKCQVTSTTVLENNISSIRVSNCGQYRKVGDDIICSKCIDYYTGVVDFESGNISQCERDSAFRENKIFGINSLFAMFFSGYECNNEKLVPAVAINDGYLSPFNNDPKSDLSTNSATKSNFCIDLQEYAENEHFELDENCGAVAILMESDDGKAIFDEAQCVSCKPGYSRNQQGQCIEIVNCNGFEYFENCSKCLNGVFKQENRTINYQKCVEYSQDSHCYAAINSTTCVLCKRGSILNKDNKCEQVVVPKCTNIGTFSYQIEIPDDQSEEEEEIDHLSMYEIWYKDIEYGCLKCETGFYPVLTTLDEKICTHSIYLKNEGNNLDQNSNYSDNCKYYQGNNLNYSCDTCRDEHFLEGEQGDCLPKFNICTITDSECTDCLVRQQTEEDLCDGEDCRTCEYCGSSYELKCEVNVQENCFIFFNGSCAVCDAYYYESDGKCLKTEVVNCKNPTSKKECDSCDSGYFLFKDDDMSRNYCLLIPPALKCTVGTAVFNEQSDNYEFTCTECAKRNQHIIENIVDNEEHFLTNSQCVEYPKIENCIEYFKESLVVSRQFECSECKLGMYLKDNKCLERKNLSDNCILYKKDKDECSKCQDFAYLNDNETKCVLKPQGIKGCLQYKSQFVCEICDDEHFLKSEKCSEITKVIQSCLIYEDAENCLICKENFNLSDDKKVCSRRSIDFCDDIQDKDTCLRCDPGYELNDNKNCDAIDISGCSLYDDEYKCVECVFGKYLENNKCTDITTNIPKCVSYASKDTCKYCNSSSILSKDKKKCLDEANLSIYRPNNCQNASHVDHQCVQCSFGYFFQEGKCIKCDNFDSCYQCDYQNQSICKLCRSGHYMDKEGKCIKIAVPVENTTQTTEYQPLLIFNILNFAFLLIQLQCLYYAQ